MRLTRSSMLEVLRQDYIRTARAKGASDQNVNYHHALRNAMLPVVTVIGIEAAFLMGGLIVTETVFNIPGVARFLVEAIRWRDYPIVQNLVMFIAVVAVLINFLVDLLYAVLDPRIQLCLIAARRNERMASIDIVPVPARQPPAPKACGRRFAITPLRIRSAWSAPSSWLVFVFAAVFADFITVYNPITHQFGASRCCRPSDGASARRRRDGPRYLQPHRLRRAHLAGGRPRARPCSAASSASRSA